MQFAPFLGFLMVALPYVINAAPLPVDTLIELPIEAEDVANDLDIDIIEILSKRVDTLIELPIEAEDVANDLDLDIIEILSKREHGLPAVTELPPCPTITEEVVAGEGAAAVWKRTVGLDCLPVEKTPMTATTVEEVATLLKYKRDFDTLLNIPINLEDVLNDLDLDILSILSRRGDQPHFPPVLTPKPKVPATTAPHHEKPHHEKPHHEKPHHDKPHHDKPHHDKDEEEEESSSTETLINIPISLDDVLNNLDLDILEILSKRGNDKKEEETLIHIPIDAENVLNDADIEILEILSKRGLGQKGKGKKGSDKKGNDHKGSDHKGNDKKGDDKDEEETLIFIPIDLENVLNDADIEILEILSKRGLGQKGNDKKGNDKKGNDKKGGDKKGNDKDEEETLIFIPIDLENVLNDADLEILQILSRRDDHEQLIKVPITVEDAVNDADIEIISILDRRA